MAYLRGEYGGHIPLGDQILYTIQHVYCIYNIMNIMCIPTEYPSPLKILDTLLTSKSNYSLDVSTKYCS